MILETLNNLSFDLQKVTADEYAGPCPFCGGNDRFRVWPDKNRYWCRQCDKKGDEIQFIRDFKGLSYVEACQHIGIQPKARNNDFTGYRRNEWQPKPAKHMPVNQWQQQARQFVDSAAGLLWQYKPIKEWLRNERGLTGATIKEAFLGYNLSDIWRERSEFGLDTVISEKTGKPKKMWIPAGLIIPCFSDGQVIRLRVRKSDPGDGDRYILLSGSDTRPMVWGADKKIFVIVESELDGLLINQVAGDVVGVVALGNAQARPDIATDRILNNADLILNSLDNDEAGAKEAWAFWNKHYHQAERWPCVGGKDPGEMFKAGFNVKTWISAGIKKYMIEWIDPLK